MKYKEIHRLHEMLLAAGIEHEWRDRTPPGYEKLVREHPDLFGACVWGWQIIVYQPDGEWLVSAIEGYGTYGESQDLIEIMGLLTPEESEHDSVVGYLTAKDVYSRIVRDKRIVLQTSEKSDIKYIT